jgi:uncharacterized RDD family membrane protein YckC
MTNPYAPPRAAVLDIVDPHGPAVTADPGTRLGAAILDGIIFAGMVYVPFMFAAIFAGIGRQAAGNEYENLGRGAENAGVIFAVAGLVAFAGLIVWCWLTIKYVTSNGQSIAKKLLGIKVVRTDGSRAALGRIFWLRNFVNGLISIVPLYGLIDALFIFGESRQCLHDKIADTIVIKA